MKKIILLVMLLSATLPLFSLSGADELFKSALEGDASFKDAAAAYAAEAREHPDDEALLYNLANALYLAGERVPALTAYGAALELKPGDPDFRANRALLLGEMGLDEIDYGAAEYILWFPLFLLGLKKLWYLVLAVLILSLTFAALHLYKKRDLFRSVSLTALFIAVLLAVSALTWESSSGRSAYVLSDDTALFKGDSPLYDTAAVLSAGTEIEVMEERAGWYRVETADRGRQEGWIKKSSFMDLDDLFETVR